MTLKVIIDLDLFTTPNVQVDEIHMKNQKCICEPASVTSAGCPTEISGSSLFPLVGVKAAFEWVHRQGPSTSISVWLLTALPSSDDDVDNDELKDND